MRQSFEDETWIDIPNLTKCDICGTFSANDSSSGKDPYHIVIMKTVNLCSLCFKGFLVDFTTYAKARIKSKTKSKDK